MLNLVYVLLFVSLPIAAAAGLAIYGGRAFGWGFREYPRATWLTVVALIAGVVLAGLAFHYFFPRCYRRSVHSPIWVCDKPIPASRL
ncbi:MAG TPA: hypothetical protein VGM68_07755 [Rhizomicrobium sp.]|jgi:Mn2+/Fe2+ NRAMP family transporter